MYGGTGEGAIPSPAMGHMPERHCHLGLSQSQAAAPQRDTSELGASTLNRASQGSGPLQTHPGHVLLTREKGELHKERTLWEHPSESTSFSSPFSVLVSDNVHLLLVFH